MRDGRQGKSALGGGSKQASRSLHGAPAAAAAAAAAAAVPGDTSA